jgi:ribosomal protein S5
MWSVPKSLQEPVRARVDAGSNASVALRVVVGDENGTQDLEV